MANTPVITDKKEGKNGKSSEKAEGKKEPEKSPLTEPLQRASDPFERMVELENQLKQKLQRAVDTEREITKTFREMSPEQRERWLGEKYDEFSATYDDYMENSGHYPAIKRVVSANVSARHELFRFPILDLTAGTGVPLEYLLKEVNKKYSGKGKTLKLRFINERRKAKTNETTVWVNDISKKMINKARERLNRLKSELRILRGRINYTNHSFREFSSANEDLRGTFGTVLISQTFHITPEKDILAQVADWALAPGGIALVVEEFQWKVSVHSNYCLRMIEDIATPLHNKSDLISYFKKNGRFPYEIEEMHTSKIDDPDHQMSGFLLLKPIVKPLETEDMFSAFRED